MLDWWWETVKGLEFVTSHTNNTQYSEVIRICDNEVIIASIKKTKNRRQ